jgi:hypothetical protein
MFIVLKKDEDGTEQVLNIFYGEDQHLISISSWIKEYIKEDIEVKKNETPLTKTSLDGKVSEENRKYKEINYEIVDEKSFFKLIKKTKAIKKGYIYNSSERVSRDLYSIRILECNSNKIIFLENSDHFNNINKEINNRVLKTLDKESLYQVLQKIQIGIYTKKQWNSSEYNGLVSETLKTFKKDMYSSIAKKMKRFGKKNIGQVPDNFSNRNQFCILESLKKDINN